MIIDRDQSGLSLIELMISITLALLITAGTISILVGNRQGFRAQDSASQMQESARYAIDYLATLIRMADLWSGVRSSFITIGSNSVTTPKSSKLCGRDWVLDVREGLHGYKGSTSPPLDCISIADYVVQSDMLAIRRIDPDSVIAPKDISRPQNAKRNYLRTHVGLDGYLYQGSQFDEAEQHIAAGPDVLDYVYDFQLLFLRPCIVKQGSVCSAQSKTPTLTSLQLQGDGGLSQVALVQNVEQMKFQYGVDIDGDQIPDSYQMANLITDWNKVKTVRAIIIVRGDALDHFRDDQIYPMGSGFCHGPATSICTSKYTGYERYQRRLIYKDIAVRNRMAQ